MSRSVRSPEITRSGFSPGSTASLHSTISQCTLVFWAVAPTAKCRELYKCFKYISSVSPTVSVSNPVLLHTLSTGSAFHTERKKSSPRCCITGGAMGFCPLPPRLLFTLRWEVKRGGGGEKWQLQTSCDASHPFSRVRVKVNIITLM